MHVCSSSYTRQQNERLVHARVQFPMVIRHRSVVRAHAENVAGIFENVSSRAVAARVCRQV